MKKNNELVIKPNGLLFKFKLTITFIPVILALVDIILKQSNLLYFLGTIFLSAILCYMLYKTTYTINFKNDLFKSDYEELTSYSVSKHCSEFVSYKFSKFYVIFELVDGRVLKFNLIYFSKKQREQIINEIKNRGGFVKTQENNDNANSFKVIKANGLGFVIGSTIYLCIALILILVLFINNINISLKFYVFPLIFILINQYKRFKFKAMFEDNNVIFITHESLKLKCQDITDYKIKFWNLVLIYKKRKITIDRIEFSKNQLLEIMDEIKLRGGFGKND